MINISFNKCKVALLYFQQNFSWIRYLWVQFKLNLLQVKMYDKI